MNELIECQNQEKSLLVQQETLSSQVMELQQRNDITRRVLEDVRAINGFLKQENRSLSDYVSKLSITGANFMDVYYNIEERLEKAIEVGEYFLRTGKNKLQ